VSKGRLLAVVGPTATGKSDVAVILAQMLDGEIVSADSMQVYKGLDIGTGKIPPEERGGILHHLIDVAEPEARFSVAEYEPLALEAIESIQDRGKLPILVGGTGLYYRAVVRPYLFEGPSADQDLRDRLTAEAESEGPDALHRRLAEVDPALFRPLLSQGRGASVPMWIQCAQGEERGRLWHRSSKIQAHGHQRGIDTDGQGS
jgi:tRNA dimethylallyltransferase